MSELFRLEDDASARRILVVGALLLVAVPLVQVGTQLWPIQISSIQWRFGAANALSAVLLLPFLGAMLLYLTARATSSRALSAFAGALAALFALGLAAGTVLFVLDALQLKTVVQSRAMAQFMTTLFRVTGLNALFTIAYGMLAFAAFRAPKAARLPARPTSNASGLVAPRKNEDAVTLIVGQSSNKSE